MEDLLMSDLATIRDNVSRHKAILRIVAERRRQNLKWGVQNHDNPTWILILMEEIGEVAKAALPPKHGGEDEEALKEELVQAAAVILAFLECLDRRG